MKKLYFILIGLVILITLICLITYVYIQIKYPFTIKLTPIPAKEIIFIK